MARRVAATAVGRPGWSSIWVLSEPAEHDALRVVEGGRDDVDVDVDVSVVELDVEPVVVASSGRDVETDESSLSPQAARTRRAMTTA
jgi:hypothetical protein